MVPAEFSMGENSAKDSAMPSVMKCLNESFWTEMRLGSSIAGGILLKLLRVRVTCGLVREVFAVDTRLFLLQKGGRRQLSQTSNLAKVKTLVNNKS